ncbi:hypothetical protein H5410_006906 [Solanum commersonii]|uniref:Uncharacterized protein n=1 Tax=Solanum commersonii TaxID=4109 RepID=A0A9J6AB23_SOLCO|nr:hypothetical protein H5410_006906 [Solanum commersonii]
MTCSICKKIGHNKAVCAKVRTQSSQQSYILCLILLVVPRTTQTNSVYNGRSITFYFQNHICNYTIKPTNQAAPLSVIRDHTAYASFSLLFGARTSSEKILHGPTKLKSASPTNIDIGFKPRGLKWKGKDAVNTSQLQQMKANRKNWNHLTHHFDCEDTSVPLPYSNDHESVSVMDTSSPLDTTLPPDVNNPITHTVDEPVLPRKSNKTHKAPAYLNDYHCPTTTPKNHTSSLSLHALFSNHHHITPDAISPDSQFLIQSVCHNSEPMSYEEATINPA